MTTSTPAPAPVQSSIWSFLSAEGQSLFAGLEAL